MSQDHFYVTTPIYYVNGQPHIGHAYTTIVADALARFHRMDAQNVFFLTGTDEHGLKVQRTAEKMGITPQQMADQNSAKFKALFDALGLSYDRFIRTTEDAHKAVVEAIYNKMLAKGDIYLDKYEGWYSASDEAFYGEDEIADGKAISSGSAVEWVEEESYFFKLSAYQDQLLDWYTNNPTCIRPEGRRNEVTSFVEGGLNDLSISRTTFDWGIPLPNDPKHVLYVWVDALTNYISALGGFDAGNETYQNFWPCDIHLIGKDILRFHAVYWPAFLLSAELPLPKSIFAHGWWLNNGVKMSKSLNNFIDPYDLMKQYDLDVLRYFMLREIPLGNDGNFDEARLIERNNAELADNYGNLVNRTLKMLKGFAAGIIPTVDGVAEEDQPLVDKALELVEQTRNHVNAFELHLALESALKLSRELNLYLQQNQPWKLAKQEDQAERLKHVLYNTLEGIRFVTLLLAPFLPEATAKVLASLKVEGQDFSTLNQWGGLPGGVEIDLPGVLFNKMDPPKKEEDEQPKPDKKKKSDKKEDKAPKDAKDGQIDFATFQSVEIKVGKVVSAERVDGSEKLLKLMIDVGEDNPRQVVSGIAKSYAPEALVNNHYAVVTNLKPAKLFGIVSQGMVLAVDKPDGSLELTQFSQEVTPGTRVS